MYKGICLFFIAQALLLNVAVFWFVHKQRISGKHGWVTFILLFFGGFFISLGLLFKKDILRGSSIKNSPTPSVSAQEYINSFLSANKKR